MHAPYRTKMRGLAHFLEIFISPTTCRLSQWHLAAGRSGEGSSGCRNVNNKLVKIKVVIWLDLYTLLLLLVFLCRWQMANFKFFERLEQVCCGQLKHYEMSVFKPSTTDIRPATAPSVAADSAAGQLLEDIATSSRNSSNRPLFKFDAGGGVLSLSLAESLSKWAFADHSRQ